MIHNNMKKKIIVSKDGPYLVSGNLLLDRQIIKCDENGDAASWVDGGQFPDQENYALCRCGHSKNKPYCDGTHQAIKFQGEETDSRQPYLKRSEKISGPELDLTDADELCASAGFCHRQGGTWSNVKNSSDPAAKEIAIEQCGNCSSGRLVTWDKKSQEPIEPDLAESLSITEHAKLKISGPIWVKGGVPIESADGTPYEARNRVTLCRCGKSRNKPFCDSTHISIKFNDGDESVV